MKYVQYGDQFKVDFFKVEFLFNVYGICKYFGSGFVFGIGKVYVNKIVDVFGIDIFCMLSEEFVKFCDVFGIGKVCVFVIKKVWDDQCVFCEIYIFFQIYGVIILQCVKFV